MPSISTARRRWLRFTTRTILILMVLVAIPLAWKRVHSRFSETFPAFSRAMRERRPRVQI